MNNYTGSKNNLIRYYLLISVSSQIPYVGFWVYILALGLLLKEVLGNAIIDGVKTSYAGTTSELKKIMGLGILLSFITFGIYGFWFVKNLIKYIVSNTYSENDQEFFNTKINAGTILKIWIVLLAVVISVLLGGAVVISYFDNLMSVLLIIGVIVVLYGLLLSLIIKISTEWVLKTITFKGKGLKWNCDQKTIRNIFIKYYVLLCITFGIYGFLGLHRFLNKVLGSIKIED